MAITSASAADRTPPFWNRWLAAPVWGGLFALLLPLAGAAQTGAPRDPVPSSKPTVSGSGAGEELGSHPAAAPDWRSPRAPALYPRLPRPHPDPIARFSPVGPGALPPPSPLQSQWLWLAPPPVIVLTPLPAADCPPCPPCR
ncbi:MAG: hypothetical protein N2688_02505 [Burkholderiaceae bacterium]|nr:hypothetical protein [Burkholderiaceae bacterium]